jgi:hypothetical protein
MIYLSRSIASVVLLLVLNFSVMAEESTTDTRPGIAPDVRDEETKLILQRGDFVVVPIPISNPTLDTGLVAGAAYFYPQSEDEQKQQPASVTAAAGMYTSNDSRALALVQQNYWNKDRWRFTGAIGAADLRLTLLAPPDEAEGPRLDWRIDGAFMMAKIARRISGDWYGGMFLRAIDANQSLATEASSLGFDTGADVRSIGAGAVVEFDSRDMPLNSYSGRHLKLDALFNDEAIGSNETYQSYTAAFRSYHQLAKSFVLAWEIQGCQRGGQAPLWDACTIKLRGFSATDYLGKSSASGQVEARLKLNKRWGVVGFGGTGWVGDSFSGIRDNESIPSYGLGLRFTVLQAKRINMRLDYARSRDSDAIHFSVGEAF